MNTFSLEIIASDKKFFSGRANAIVLPTPDGEVAVMAHHQNMLMAVVPGTARFEPADSPGVKTSVVVSSGFAEVIRCWCSPRSGRRISMCFGRRKPRSGPRSSFARSRASRSITGASWRWPGPCRAYARGVRGMRLIEAMHRSCAQSIRGFVGKNGKAPGWIGWPELFLCAESPRKTILPYGKTKGGMV